MIVDTQNTKVTVWVTKLPQIIADSLKNIKKDTNIGTISIEKGHVNDIVKFHLSPEMLALGLPSEYDVEMNLTKPNMYVLRTDPNPRIEGSVNKDCAIRPVLNAEYFAFKKAQKELANNQQPACQTITLREANTTDKISGVADIDYLSKKRKKMLSDKKRGRIDKRDVMNMIFNAYEEVDAWTAKDMSIKINQPMAYTQEIMNEICYLNKKDQRNTYVLKPEYKPKH